jgi:hypothetical protein
MCDGLTKSKAATFTLDPGFLGRVAGISPETVYLPVTRVDSTVRHASFSAGFSFLDIGVKKFETALSVGRQ